MKKILCVLMIIMIIMLASCVAGPNDFQNKADSKGNLAGFWQGLLHGCISFVTFCISLFNKNVNVYEVHNNGGWYNFGFILGIMIIFGGSGGGAGKKMWKKPINNKKA